MIKLLKAHVTKSYELSPKEGRARNKVGREFETPPLHTFKESLIMPSKKLAQRIHAKKRLEERYGLTVNRKELREIISLIQGGNACFLERKSTRVTKWQLQYKGRDIIALYDKNRKNLITVLPQKNG